MSQIATATAPPVPGKDISGRVNDNVVKANLINEMRIEACVKTMTQRLQNAAQFDAVEFYELCLSLARGIDFSVANHEISKRAQDLPSLLKQMCQTKSDAFLLPASMVLMISVKSASESNWFSEKDAEELCGLANEIRKHFSSSMDCSIEPSSPHPTISTIMSRFYPRIEIGQILVQFEAKPGFGAFVKDFKILKQRYPGNVKVRLLVARTDSTETSSCLVRPPQVNFLLNGKGVEGRTTVSLDLGPQMPSNVTDMLKYGSNLLQSIGDFNGNYIIVVALMSDVSTISNLVIPDYVQPAPAMVDPDSDVIEGPSRISLNCPISRKRIKTPVKGHSCKHHQCFDLDNYLDINSKKPSWRCPDCNNFVCFTDIRIDQNIVKVLNDVIENVDDVIISSDGSWKAITGGDDHLDKQKAKLPGEDEEISEQLDTAQFLNDSPDLLDLTGLDTEMDAITNIDSDDRKVSNTQDDFWSGIYLSTFESQMPNAALDLRNVNSSDPSLANVVLPPLSPDVISPTLNRDVRASTGNALVLDSGSLNEISSPTGWQMQQYQYGNVANSNEYGRSLSMPRNVTRTPSAIQALPAQASTPVFHRPRNNANIYAQGASLMSSQTSGASLSGDGLHGNPRSMERQPQFSRSNSLQPSRMASSSLQPHLNTHHNRPFYSVPHSQQSTGFQVPNRFPLVAGPQFQSVGRSSANYSGGQPVQGGTQAVSSSRIGDAMDQQVQMAAARRAAHLAKAFQASPGPAPSGNMEGARMSQQTFRSVAGPETFVDVAGDQDWRPTGRMRGSLQGQAFSEALSHYTLQTPQQGNRAPSLPSNQQADRATSVPSNQQINSPLSSSASSQLQILMANRAALQEAHFPSGLSGLSSPSGVFPQPPPGMN